MLYAARRTSGIIMTGVPPPRSSKNSSGTLERIALHMASSLDLQPVLTTITQGLVDDLNAAFARIWLW